MEAQFQKYTLNTFVVKKKRNSSFELLRIILMILIVLHHTYLGNKYIRMLDYKKIELWKYITLKILSNYGPFANNIFIMISGYFSVSKINFNIHKFLSILFEIYTYYYPSIFLGKKLRKKYKNLKFPNYKSKEIYFPIISSSSGNWFAQIYLSLILFFPYINNGLMSLNRKKYKNLVIIIIFFYCIFNSIIKFYGVNSIIFQDTHLIKLLLPYILGGYICLHMLKNGIWKIIGLIFFPLTILLEIVSDVAFIRYKYYNFALFKSLLFYEMNSIFSIIGSIGIIYLFKNISFYNKGVNWIAASSFAIYLIHGNKNISSYIHNIWFPINNIHSKFFFFKYFIKAVLIVIICILIDILRRYTIGLLFEKIIKKIIIIYNKFFI